MTVLTLDEVRVEPDAAALAGAGISRPAPGETVGAPSFVVRGWALGAAARALAVEIRSGAELVRVVPVREPTRDVAGAHPDRPDASRCGFLTRVHTGALEGASDLRLEAVLANGARAAIGTIALGHSERPPRAARGARAVPSIHADVERLVVAEAQRLGLDPAALLEVAPIPALAGVDLRGRRVLDLSGGPGHVARAARAGGAALVDSVHLGDDLAGLARLLDVYHRTTRVFVHAALEDVDGSYDAVVALGPEPPVAPETLADVVVRG